MTTGVGSTIIPGTGTFFVGIDLPPGRYRCENGKGGWWVRFTGADGGEPVGSWPLPPGPHEVEIDPADFAFETHVSGQWRMIAPPVEAGRDPRREVRPVVDPTLRGELDVIVARRRPMIRAAAVVTITVLCLLSHLLIGAAWPIAVTPLAIMVLAGARYSDDLRRAHALTTRRDRYLEPEDLDDDARSLLARVQAAVETVQRSQVNREGMLDTADNAVTLPRQEWEIAQVLARQTRLRREQREFLAGTEEIPEVTAAMRPLLDKLDRSVRTVTLRVEALERYADRARVADEALRAQRRLADLAGREHHYDELLVHAVRDELAIPDIERLIAHGDALVESLHRRLADAAEAGGEPPG